MNDEGQVALAQKSLELLHIDNMEDQAQGEPTRFFQSSARAVALSQDQV